jgi:hypothetical protein
MPRSTKPISVGRAVSCGLVNQLATPGLGSLIGRRFVAGVVQLLLAVAGFLLITGWIVLLFYQRICEALEQPVKWEPHDWQWQAGLILFGAAWLWSLVTSISLLRQAKQFDDATAKNPPPRIDDVAGRPAQK